MAKSKDGNAVWERDLKVTFCELCLKEVELGNRPTTHFNREGWLNITTAFKEKSGREYTKTQLKNKWDQLKKDWKLWKELKRGATGLGWCNIRKTIDASEEWWQEKLEVLPNARKFRFAGIDPEMEEMLDKMFSGVVAMGLHARTTAADGRSVDFDPEEAHSLGSEGFINSHEFDVDHSPSIPPSTRAEPGPKRKRGKPNFLKEGISTLLSHYSTLASSKSAACSSSMASAMKILQDTPEIMSDMTLFLKATKVLENPTRREAFISLQPNLRFAYINFHMSGDDV